MTVATKFYTWDELWAEVADLTDMEDEDFVDQAEAMVRVNGAIDEAEALIHQLNEGYFLDKDPLTLIDATDEYAMPSKIYGHKIVRLVYRNGTKCYEIKRDTRLAKEMYYERELAEGNTSLNSDMMYFLRNSGIGTPKIVLTPPPGEAGQYVTVWFYRQANRMATGSDVIDIPEFSSFIRAYLIEWIYWKIQAGGARHLSAQQETERQRQLMISTLKEMVVDGDSLIEQDLSHYEEHN